MVMILSALAIIFMLATAYLLLLAEMTRPRHAHRYQDLQFSFAVCVLTQIKPDYQKRNRKVLGRERYRWYSRGFMGDVMPKMFEEARRATLAGRSLLAYWHFGFFCLVYGLVWAKMRLAAHAEDMRYVAGAELPLLRRTGVPEYTW